MTPRVVPAVSEEGWNKLEDMKDRILTQTVTQESMEMKNKSPKIDQVPIFNSKEEENLPQIDEKSVITGRYVCTVLYVLKWMWLSFSSHSLCILESIHYHCDLTLGADGFTSGCPSFHKINSKIDIFLDVCDLQFCGGSLERM